MSLSINDAGINVQISRETRSPSQRGFGALLFITVVGAVTTRLKLYTSFAGVAEDYSSGDEAYAAAAAFYSQTPSPIDFYVGQVISGESISDALDDFLTIDANFYCVSIDRTLDEQDQLDAAGWVEPNQRFFSSTSNDAGIIDSGVSSDLASQLQTLGYDRTMLIYSTAPDSYPGVSAFAILATTSFRGTNTLKTLKFKDLSGVPVEDVNPDQLNTIASKNANVFYTTASIRMFDSGRVSSGSWADEVHGADALAEEIRTRVFGLLSRSSTKIPYNERGMALLEAEVEGGLAQFVTNGYLTARVDSNGDILPGYEVWHLPVIDASEIDKAARIAPDIQFRARLAGAIHEILINGVLTLD